MNANLSAVILDDEQNNINLLKKVLQKHCPDVTVIGQQTDSEAGLTLIETLRPELVFLDIHMPNLNGFEVLKKLEPISFEVIFVTAFSEHAIEAFEYHAIGYITKPIHPDKLVTAVDNARERIVLKNSTKNIFSLIESRINHNQEDKIPLTTLGGLLFLNKEDIIYCESKGNYTQFHTVEGKRIMVLRRLGEYEKLLPNTLFVRIHEKYIINLKYVNEYIKGRGGEIKLNKVITLPVSALRKETLLARYDKWLKH